MQEKREQRDCVSGDRNCQLAAHHYFVPQGACTVGKTTAKRETWPRNEQKNALVRFAVYWIYLRSPPLSGHERRRWQPGEKQRQRGCSSPASGGENLQPSRGSLSTEPAYRFYWNLSDQSLNPRRDEHTECSRCRQTFHCRRSQRKPSRIWRYAPYRRRHLG